LKVKELEEQNLKIEAANEELKQRLQEAEE